MARHKNKNRSGGGQESCCLTNREWRVSAKPQAIAKPHYLARHVAGSRDIRPTIYPPYQSTTLLLIVSLK